MNPIEPIPDIGPLPQSDDNAELQRRSLKALNSLLENQDAIFFRDERIEDYGVDGSFELKISNSVTNFRAQVQMKGTASIDANNDGSMSLSVQTANLNYLLNGPSPIYVLYDAKKKEFWYVWAQEENRRLEAENSAWKQQGTITIKFTQRLTTDVLAAVHGRILREGCMHRQIHDSLARATTNEAVVVRIDASSLSITDPLQARDALLATGPAIVAAGFPKQALQLMQLLNSTIRDLPRIQLTAGYAEYMLGKHYNALGHIRQAIAKSQELSDRDRSFLATLKDACEFRVGIIDAATYQRQTGERAQSLTGIELLEAAQDKLYHQCLNEHNPDIRASLAERIRGVTTQIINHHEATNAIKLGARLILLYVEGTMANLAAICEARLASVRAIMYPNNTDIPRSYQNARSLLAEWEASSEQALKHAHELRHPILIGEAYTVVLSVRIGKLLDKRFDALWHDVTFEVANIIRAKMRQDFETALMINELNGTVEGRLRLNKLHVDFLELIGDITAAKELAAKIRPEAEAMGFMNIAERAKELLEDRTILMEFERDLKYLKHADQDVVFASYSDEELHRFAHEVLHIVGSPSARPEVIDQYCLSLREIARERCHWCRYLQILEDLTQTTDQSIAFSTLPNRSCFCAKFGYETEIVTQNAHALIGTFKQLYCAVCTARSPKQG